MAAKKKPANKRGVPAHIKEPKCKTKRSVTKLTPEAKAVAYAKNRARQKETIRQNIKAGILISKINKSIEELNKVIEVSKTAKSEVGIDYARNGKQIKKRNKVDADIIRDKAIVHQRIVETQINAQLALLKKVLPDMKQVEIDLGEGTVSRFAGIISELRKRDNAK